MRYFLGGGQDGLKELPGAEASDASPGRMTDPRLTRGRWRSRRCRLAVVVQARMSSRRLPGKVLEDLAGAPALVRQLERVQLARHARELVVATSVDPSDDPLYEACRSAGVPCIRGPLDDVLARYLLTAEEVGADVVVRVTGDCPLFDPDVLDECVDLYHHHAPQVRYASNVDERTYPDGLDVEVVAVSALREAHARTSHPADREHVTPYVRRSVPKVTLAQEVDLSALRWTLDYPEDLEFVRTVYAELYTASGRFQTEDVYRLLLRRPELIRTEPTRPVPEGRRPDLLFSIREHLGR